VLQAGASPDDVTIWDRSPLCVAVFSGNVQLVERLIRLGADVNRKVRYRQQHSSWHRCRLPLLPLLCTR